MFIYGVPSKRSTSRTHIPHQKQDCVPRNARPSSLATHPHLPSAIVPDRAIPGTSIIRTAPFWTLLSTLEGHTQRSNASQTIREVLLSVSTHTLLHSASRYPALRPPSWGLLGDMGQHHTHTVTEALRSNQPRCNSQAGNTYRWSGTSTDGLRDLVSITKTLHVHNSLFQVSVLISSVRYLLTMCRRFKSSETVL